MGILIIQEEAFEEMAVKFSRFTKHTDVVLTKNPQYKEADEIAHCRLFFTFSFTTSRHGHPCAHRPAYLL